MRARSQHARFVAQFFEQLGGGFFRRAGDEFGLLGFLRHVDALDVLGGLVRDAERFARRSVTISFFLAAMMPLSVA